MKTEPINRLNSLLEKSSNMNFSCKLLLVILSILALFFGDINQYLGIILNPEHFYYDEAMFLPSFYKYLPDPTPTNYAKEYTLNVMMGMGFKEIFKFIYANLDVALSISIIKLSILIIATILVGIIAWEIGGALISFSTIVLFLSTSQFFFFSLNGITPRCLAYVCILLAVLSILKKTPHLLAAVVIFSALFYPQSAFIAGTLMAMWMLLVPKNVEIYLNWSLKRKFILLAIIGITAFVLTIPQVMAAAEYGRRLVISDIPEYPEIGKGGLYSYTDSLPYTFLWSDLGLIVGNMLAAKLHNPVAFIFTFLFMFGIVGHSAREVYKQNPKFTAIMIMLATGLVTYIAAYIFQPYLYIAIRYLQYTLPLFMIFFIPLGMKKLFGKYTKNRKYLSGIITAIIISLYSTAGDNAIIHQLEIDNRASLYNFIKTTPKESVIAGWPLGVTNNIPLFGYRNALITGATHYVFNKDYTDEMRARANVVIDAYAATSTQPLIELRDEFGATHFLVERKYFTCGDKFEYTLPFTKGIEEKLNKMNLEDSILTSKSLQNAIVYEDLDFILLDLSKI